MRRQEFIDGYDWKARYIPTVILLAPLCAPPITFIPEFLRILFGWPVPVCFRSP
jgi:hypothetical protein